MRLGEHPTDYNPGEHNLTDQRKLAPVVGKNIVREILDAIKWHKVSKQLRATDQRPNLRGLNNPEPGAPKAA